MKKCTFCLILLLATQLIRSQDERIIVDLEQFTQLKAFDGLSVNLIKSSENKAVITGANTR